MPTATQITVTQPDVNGARCQALFSSGLQPSDAPTAGMVAIAISRAVQQFGIGGCAGRMAQEFGDHPDAAARRMRWVRQLIAQEPAALDIAAFFTVIAAWFAIVVTGRCPPFRLAT